jgi:hypothetical protein
MITFKQFLREDEEDKGHNNPEEAAIEYMKHCSQFPDVNKPLYRISGSMWDPKPHSLRTRSPRTRESASRGGSEDEQAFLFSQPEWSGYPARRQSIFCSTNPESDVGSVDPDKNNLLMIFPFDGVKIALLDDKDLNTMNIAKATSWGQEETIRLQNISSTIAEAFEDFKGYYPDTYTDHAFKLLQYMKESFLKGGSFDPQANGNADLAKKYSELDRKDQRYIKFVVTEIPEKLSPKDLGVKLITSSELDLPGKTRECWFSGKYLSIPAKKYVDFVEEVEELQKRKAK